MLIESSEVDQVVLVCGSDDCGGLHLVPEGVEPRAQRPCDVAWKAGVGQVRVGARRRGGDGSREPFPHASLVVGVEVLPEHRGEPPLGSDGPPEVVVDAGPHRGPRHLDRLGLAVLLGLRPHERPFQPPDRAQVVAHLGPAPGDAARRAEAGSRSPRPCAGWLGRGICRCSSAPRRAGPATRGGRLSAAASAARHGDLRLRSTRFASCTSRVRGWGAPSLRAVSQVHKVDLRLTRPLTLPGQ